MRKFIHLNPTMSLFTAVTKTNTIQVRITTVACTKHFPKQYYRLYLEYLQIEF